MAPGDITDDTDKVDNVDIEYSFVHGYVTVIDEFPITILSLILSITLGCGVITYMLHGIPSFREPRLGIETRNTELSSRDMSFWNFLNTDLNILSPVPRGYPVPLPAGGTIPLEEMPRAKEIACPKLAKHQLKIVFESSQEGESLFNAEHLKSICRQEADLVRSHRSFKKSCYRKVDASQDAEKKSCCPSWSLGHAVALFSNRSSCLDITDGDVGTAKSLLRTCSQYYDFEDPDYDKQSPDVGDVPPDCLDGGLASVVFEFLTPKSFPGDIRRGSEELDYTLSFSPMGIGGSCPSCEEDATAIYNDNFQDQSSLGDGTTKAVAMDFGLKLSLFDISVITDFRFLALSLLSAAVIIWTHTGSFLIMVGSLLNMLLSTVMALFIYYNVFQVRFFPFSNLAALILVIGIGVDDTFVYVDLWKAAKDKLPWPDGNHERLIAIEEATRHAALTVFVTTLTTTSAFFITTSSNIIAVKCFALFAGTLLAANFVYTITWLPTVIVLHEKYIAYGEERESSHEGRLRSALRATKMAGSTLCYNARSMAKIVFQTALPKLIFSLRYVWIAVSVILCILGMVSTFIYPGLELEEGTTIRLFQDKQPFESYDQFYRNSFQFAQTGETFPISFMWGILPTRDQNSWDPFDQGVMEIDSSFQLEADSTQRWLLDFCDDMKHQWFSANTTEHVCFIDTAKLWMERPCSSSVDLPCCGQDAFPFPPDVFEECSKRYSALLCQRSPCSKYMPGVRFGGTNNSIKALYLHFRSSVPYTLSFQSTDVFWKDLFAWSTEKMRSAPEGLKGGWVHSRSGLQLGLYDLQVGIPRSTLFTVCITLALTAFVQLVTTRNIPITVFAVLTIVSSVVSAVGFLVWLGWELNLFESLLFTVMVGLSIDFSIHFGVAYGISPARDRKGRTIFVMETLGSSITVAALSTFTAGAAMVPAIVITYHQTGVFLMTIMVFSWYYSFFLFLPLCFVFGPENEDGLLTTICRPGRCRKVSGRLSEGRNPVTN